MCTSTCIALRVCACLDVSACMCVSGMSTSSVLWLAQVWVCVQSCGAWWLSSRMPDSQLREPEFESNLHSLFVELNGQGHEHLYDTGMPVRNWNLGYDRTTTTKAASMRKQLGTKNRKSKRADRRKMVELREETGVQTTVGRTRRKDSGRQTTEESGRVTWAGQEETREAKAEMGGLC